MEKLATLLLAQPRAVIESGVVIPCALQDLLAVVLEDCTCRFRSEVLCAFPAAVDALPRTAQHRNDH